MTNVNVVAVSDAIELWAAIPGFSKLEASTHGRIRSCAGTRKAGEAPYRVLSLSRTTKYPLLAARKDGAAKFHTFAAHKLIASAFLGEKPDGMLVLHRNDVPSDNRLSNLYYGTHSDNYRDSVDNGARFQGPNPKLWGHRSSITPAQVRAIRRQAAAGKRKVDISASVGVAYRAVQSILSGKSFRWVCDTDSATKRYIESTTAVRALHKVDAFDAKAKVAA